MTNLPYPVMLLVYHALFGMEVLHEFITTGHRSETYQSRAKDL